MILVLDGFFFLGNICGYFEIAGRLVQLDPKTLE